ncbi:MAG TPA: hypothetical protein VL096_00950 [Pirellulaceae bacterium]|nr:hypothetical protein [Pirellulaceae bacterium]
MPTKKVNKRVDFSDTIAGWQAKLLVQRGLRLQTLMLAGPAKALSRESNLPVMAGLPLVFAPLSG